MTPHQTSVIHECIAQAHQTSFGKQIGQLMEIGIERYHADYSRHENTYYLPDGDSLVAALPGKPHAVGADFSAAAIQSAVHQAQRGEIFYPEFSRQATAAGCVGYFVQIAGRQVIYFGRNGEQHVEKFPPPAP